MDTKGNLYITHADGSVERTTEAWKRLEAEGRINQEKLTILNRDGTTTEVEPVKMWTPDEAELAYQAAAIEQTMPHMNRHERRKAAALARKGKK